MPALRLALLATLSGCVHPPAGDGGASGGGDVPAVDDPVETVPDSPCPNPAEVFAEDCVVRYDLTIADADWRAMQAVYDTAVGTGGAVDWASLRAVHPATLGYGQQSLEVGIRLKGNPATFLAGRKMQFRIDVDRFVPDQDFHGLTSLNLEAAAYDPTGLKNGLAFSVFDDVGLVTPAANHAELWVNGVYYGVYENIEQINGRFLHHHYDDPSGNLYWFIWNGHYGELRSNEEIGDTSDWDAMEALVNATPGTVYSTTSPARSGR
jgi:hypothetical protein